MVSGFTRLAPTLATEVLPTILLWAPRLLTVTETFRTIVLNARLEPKKPRRCPNVLIRLLPRGQSPPTTGATEV